MMGFFTAPRVAFGPGATGQLTGLGIQRALVVADPAIVSGDPLHRVLEELGKVDATIEVFEAVLRGAPLSSVEAGVVRARSFRPDTIIAVGGGSAIDTAKGVWVGFASPETPLGEITPLLELDLRRTTRMIAVPTTGGSGAEATWTVRFRSDDGTAGVEMSSRELVADWALLDPSFTLSLPPKATAEAGAELIGLALEALASEWANPFSDALARSAIAASLPALPRAVRHPDNVDARSTLLHSATMAGMAAANSQVGVAQALAQSLGDVFPIPYGRLVAALLPYVLEFNHPVARERYSTLGPSLGSAATQHRTSLSERVRAAWEPSGLPRTLAAAGIPAEELRAKLPVVVDRAARTPAALGNPRVPSREELTRLVTAALEGSAVDF
ncbi:MAG: iron-containing alcohol dehydrogenase [Thermoplasmata archaeon]|nr:iron-containing alcohol dehydrogenase [Thermoplasmata archaeon]